MSSSNTRQHGDHAYIHLDFPGGATEQLRFQPGIKLRSAREMYPTAKVRAMTEEEIEAWHKKRRRATELVRAANW